MKYLRVIISEVYKLLIKKKFLIVCVLLLGFDVITFSGSIRLTTFLNPKSDALYTEKIAHLQGAYDQDKVDTMKAEISKVFTFEKELEKHRNEPKVYYEMLNSFTDFYELNSVYELLDTQIKYVEKDTNHRYFLNVYGYSTLMENVLLDLLIFVLAIIMASTMFTNEIETEVEVLNRSSYLGRTYRFIMQALVITTVLVVLMASIYAARFGIIWRTIEGTLSFPLQSLPRFSGAIFDISIIQGLILIFLSKVFALIFIIAIVSCIALYSKSSTFTTYLSFVIVVVPVFLIPYMKKYIYPLPLIWMFGEGLLETNNMLNSIIGIKAMDMMRLGQLALYSLGIVTVLWVLNILKIRKGD